jgi:D-galactarolactone cycloisomerase
MHPFKIQRIRIYVYQAPANPPIRSSFGQIKERSSLIIAIDDDLHNTGWGEIWSGLPAFGAKHRAQLLQKIVAPQLIGKSVANPAQTYQQLYQSLRPIIRLAGEPGPVSQVLAGLDCALWDLVARRAQLPLYQILGAEKDATTVRVYASGLSPHADHNTLDQLRKQGHIAFKLKAGFDDQTVLPEIARIGRELQKHESIMIDANCGWDINQAIAAANYLSDTPLQWVEEPLGPECSYQEWMRFKAACLHPVAAGENMLSQQEFENSFNWLDVIQPDLGKWGGISSVVPLARQAIASGLRYCPHTFGTNVGAAHAAHVLAAIGGDGLLELDINNNPLRNLAPSAITHIHDGIGTLNTQPGIGIDIHPDALASFLQDAMIVQAE